MEEQTEQDIQQKNRGAKTARVFSGLFLIGVGLVFIARANGMVFASWLFTWPMFLIALGVYIGIKHMFRNPGWLVLVVIGSLFLVGDIYPDISLENYVLPIVLIIAGLFVVFKPFKSYKYKGRFRHHNRFKNLQDGREVDYEIPYVDPCAEETSEDRLDTVAILGGVKKNVISKNFKGGDVVCVMGGAEINLINADIQGTVELEMVQVFGGAKLILPAHWEVRSEAVVILGGIEDKRPPVAEKVDSKKVLIIRGTCIFGGIDIRSY